MTLFTKTKNVERFCRGKHSGVKGFQAVPMYSFQNAGELRDFLIANEGPFEEQRCRHVAFDPQPNVPPMYAPIRDFLDYLLTVE